MARRQRLIWAAAISIGISAGGSRGEDLGPPIDFSTFGDVASAGPADAADLPVENVARWSEPAARRFYLTGIIGASFATLATGGAVDLAGDRFPMDGSINNTLFTAGGAAGVAFDRANGLLRAEFEARGRDVLRGQNNLSFPDGSFFDNPQVRATDGWSTMANLWRDFDVGERAGIYAGGGIGAGGYRFISVLPPPPTATSGVTEFAWQAGGGVTYAFTERLTLDLGYRFFSIGTGNSSVTAPANPFGDFSGTATSSFTASELLLSVRVYEPFRNWR
jgi:opacity protein-like surface antigen